jgi:outer membrane receptor for ferric coprogen and ferric-rhodotorulic acid
MSGETAMTVTSLTAKCRARGLKWRYPGSLRRRWQVFAGYTLNNSKYLEAAATRKGTNYSKHRSTVPFV